MYFCVFSYNRGRHLANCIRSIEANVIVGETSVLPVAEDFLRLRDNQLSEPWVYYPLERMNLLRHLNRVEPYFSRLFSRT